MRFYIERNRIALHQSFGFDIAQEFYDKYTIVPKNRQMQDQKYHDTPVSHLKISLKFSNIYEYMPIHVFYIFSNQIPLQYQCLNRKKNGREKHFEINETISINMTRIHMALYTLTSKIQNLHTKIKTIFHIFFYSHTHSLYI